MLPGYTEITQEDGEGGFIIPDELALVMLDKDVFMLWKPPGAATQFAFRRSLYAAGDPETLANYALYKQCFGAGEGKADATEGC